MSSNDPANQKTILQCFRVEDVAASVTRNSNIVRPNNFRFKETNLYNGSLSQKKAISVATSNSVISIQNQQSNTNSYPNQTTLTQHICSDDTVISASRNNIIAIQNHQSNTNNYPNQTTLTQHFSLDDTAIPVATRNNTNVDQNRNSNLNENPSASINEAVDSVQSNDDQGSSDRLIGNNSNDNSGGFVDEYHDDSISATNSRDSQETVFYDTSFLTQRSFETTDE